MIRALAVLAVPGVSDAMQSGCRADAEPSRRVELPDGRAISTDVKSLARSGESVMAVGARAYVFPRGAMPRSDAMMKDSIIGFVLNAKGVASIVGNPPGVTRAYHPRVAAAPDGSFHVLYVTTEINQDGLVPTSDTATIWYARFHNGRWRNIERVVSTRGARLIHESASVLLERGGELSFLFPFVTPEARGLILLRRTASRWHADTLRTVADPVSAAAIYENGGSLVATFTMSGRQIDSSFTELLFATRFRSSWSVPVRIGGDGVRPVAIPSLLRVGRTVVRSWIEWTWGNAASSQLHWLPSATDSVAKPVASGPGTFPYASVVLDDRYPLWLIRGAQYGTSLSVLLGSGSLIEPLGTFTVPFENPKASAVALGNDRVLVLTMKQGKLPDEPMVASIATILQFRCPDPARR